MSGEHTVSTLDQCLPRLVWSDYDDLPTERKLTVSSITLGGGLRGWKLDLGGKNRFKGESTKYENFEPAVS